MTPTTEPTKVVFRLAPEVYRQLESKMYRPIVTADTTAHQAGYQLGIAAVLKELRNGYVVES
jgi:hypothetical protein